MLPKLTKLELRIMEIVWASGPISVRAVQERMPATVRPAYTTVQTMIYRLEAKGALRRKNKVGNAHLFEPLVTRASAHKRLINEFFAALGGKTQLVMAHLVDAGKLTLGDVQEAETRLRELQKKRARK